MASVYIHLHVDGAPKVHVLTHDSGEHSMNINITDYCTVFLPGRDCVTVQYALALATAIREAAENIQASLEQAAPAVVQ